MRIRILPAFLLLFAALPASAKDVTIVPSIGYGMSNLTFTRSTGEVDDSRFSVVDLGLTAAYGKAYVKLSAEMPLGQEFTYGPALIRQFKRDDFGVTAGYSVMDQVSVFAGYSYGKTSIVSFDGGGGLPPYPVYTQHLDQGPFVGANYSMFVGKTGTLGFNIAYANMDGSMVIQDSDPGGVSTTESGTTSGFSLGITWSDTYKDKLSYYLTYKRKNYETDLVTISIDKSFDILTFGVVFPI